MWHFWSFYFLLSLRSSLNTSSSSVSNLSWFYRHSNGLKGCWWTDAVLNTMTEHCQRAASLYNVKWQLLCLCFSLTSFPRVTAPLHLARLSSSDHCSPLIYLVLCRKPFNTITPKLPYTTYLSCSKA